MDMKTGCHNNRRRQSTRALLDVQPNGGYRTLNAMMHTILFLVATVDLRTCRRQPPIAKCLRRHPERDDGMKRQDTDDITVISSAVRSA
jgi:hypothetical protein